MIRLMCQFLGRPLSEARIEQISRLCSFEEMRTNAMVNREQLPVPDLFDMSQSKFMRKGIIGDWRNHFSQEESDQFDQHYLGRLATIGLDLAFDHDQALRMVAQREGRIIRLPATVPDRRSSDDDTR